MKLSMPYVNNTWYHVTHRDRLQSIRDHGLTPTDRGNAGKNWDEYSVVTGGIYLSPNITSAEGFRQPQSPLMQQTGWQSAEGIILQVTNIDQRRLHPDPEAMTYELEAAASYEPALEDAPELVPLVRATVAGGGWDKAGQNVWTAYMALPAPQQEAVKSWWAETHPTNSWVYLGTIPAQFITLATHPEEAWDDTSGREEILQRTEHGLDDYDDEYADHYKYRKLIGKTANPVLAPATCRHCDKPASINMEFTDGTTVPVCPRHEVHEADTRRLAEGVRPSYRRTTANPSPIQHNDTWHVEPQTQPDIPDTPPTSTGNHWVYVNGKVAFGTHHADIAHEAATLANLPSHEAARLSNLVARNHSVSEPQVAWGSLRPLRDRMVPQIWLTNVDRNAVWDAVMRANQRRETTARRRAARTPAHTLPTPTQAPVPPAHDLPDVTGSALPPSRTGARACARPVSNTDTEEWKIVTAMSLNPSALARYPQHTTFGEIQHRYFDTYGGGINGLMADSTPLTFQMIPLSSLPMNTGTDDDLGLDDPYYLELHSAIEQGSDVPPLIVESRNGSYVILDGWHRTTIARHLGLTEFPAYVYDPADPHRNM